jgi:hypothetical protein
MATFYFQETCTSLPTYKIEANSIEEAYKQYVSGKSVWHSEEVEENFLVSVYDENNKDLEFPESWQDNSFKV